MDTDETLARHLDMGAATHRVIASLAVAATAPNYAQIKDAVSRALPHLSENEARAHRQNLIGQAVTYFQRLIPGTGWSFHGSEVHLGVGRVDLLWRANTGHLLVDELKTGHRAFFGTATHMSQGRHYLRECRRLHGPSVTGLRLLCISSPRHSLYLADPTGDYVPLLLPS